MVSTDHSSIRDVYFDAITSKKDSLYNQAQIQAWASLAWLPGILDRPLQEGEGWVITENNEIAAFAVLHPLNRLSLLYCRQSSARRGYATALLKKLESEARKSGQIQLITEASFFSFPLLLKYGWVKHSSETIYIAGIAFERFKMIKSLIH